MRQIAIINQKGGVGKTTTCCNVGAAIAAAGRKVLLIDLDPQAHLTMHLGIEPTPEQPSIYDVLTDNLPVADAIVPLGEQLHLLPSNIDLAAAEMELVSIMGREVILRDALANLPEPYDFVIIDCPPSLGVLTVNGLAAMNEVIVPMQPHFLALQGVGKLLETIRLVKDRINSDLLVSGIVLCMYDAGTRLASEVSADLSQFLEASRDTAMPWSQACVYKTIIRRNIKLAECPSHGKTIADYAPHSNGAADYASLAAEILKVDSVPITSAIQPRAGKSVRVSVEAPPPPTRAPDASPGIEPATAPPAPASAPEEGATPEVAQPFALEDRLALGPDEVDTESAPTPALEATDESTAIDNPSSRVVPEINENQATDSVPAVAPPLSIPIRYEEDDEAIGSEAEMRHV